jgi:hypothetical protein
MRDINTIIQALLDQKAKKATKFISEKEVVRVVRKTYKGKSGARHFENYGRGNIELIVTIGKPNYAEREFVKLLKKAKEPFPVKKIQFKF